MKNIYFVSSSRSKYADFKRRFDKAGLPIKHKPVDLDEIRSLDVKKIVKDKMRQARKEFPGEKLVVEDRAFIVPSLAGFPGPYVKLIMGTIGVDGILKLMRGQKDKTAKFVSVACYFDGQKEHLFQSEEVGFILNKKKGHNLHNWTELLYIYGYFLFPGLSLAEYDDEQWQEYIKEIEKNDYIEKLTEFIKK